MSYPYPSGGPVSIDHALQSLAVEYSRLNLEAMGLQADLTTARSGVSGAQGVLKAVEDRVRDTNVELREVQLAIELLEALIAQPEPEPDPEPEPEPEEVPLEGQEPGEDGPTVPLTPLVPATETEPSEGGEEDPGGEVIP